MAARWEVDEKGLAETLRGPGVGAHLTTIARTGVDKARASAPVRTGSYRDSLVVLEARTEGDHLVAGFGSDSWHWHFVEFGTATNHPYRILGDTAEAVADRVDHK